MANVQEDTSQMSSVAEGKVFAAPRMIVGITSAQTCLVLTSRLRALRQAGFAVTLVSSPGELLTRTAEVDGVTAFAIPISREIAPYQDLQSLIALWRFLRTARPEITDFSTPKAGLLGNLAAWSLRVPHRVYTLRGLKLESSSGWKRTILLWSERLSAACAHVVLCNSESLRAEAVWLRIAPARKLRILGDGSSNGVDTERFSPVLSPKPSLVRADFGIPIDAPVLGFVGRLTLDKGIPELLAAFDEVLRRVPECWLLLVGWFDASEDSLEGNIRAHVATHPRIRHTGFVADTAPYYRAMDILILPTHREGFPNVVLEAAASGVPVISTFSTGARDAVVPEVTGLLIQPGHVEAIVDAVLELLESPVKRMRMGKAAREWVLARFSNERVLGLAVEFYRELVKHKNRE